MTTPSSWNLLSAHHLLNEILELVERANSYAVMVTAYLDPWQHLELALRKAVERGVTVHIITRSADDTHNDKAKRAKSIERLRALGVTFHEVDWLHTKLYVSEKEAIVASLNLTATGRDGPNLGVHLHGRQAASQALREIDQWIPGFSSTVAAPIAASSATSAPAFCIRCQGARAFFNPGKPYCSDCWHARKSEQGNRTEACCHRCGAAAETVLRQPLCTTCGAKAPMRTAG
ncbi:MAG: phospholipase D-like domain-containing protein [Planctomycetia bacterium]|nr:phospholipase D-like domain-containing protein [Planctomycetia bacterium]